MLKNTTTLCQAYIHTHRPSNSISSDDPAIWEDFTGKAKAKIVQIPFAMGAIAVFFNGNGVIKSMKLDGCVLAKIFSRKIKKWNHKDIAALNPGATLPDAAIVVVRRAPGSSSTAATTGYFAKVAKQDNCPDAWQLKNGLTIDWPSDTVEVVSSGTMSAAIKKTPYAIGYVDAGHGYGKGLSEVQLKDANGDWLRANKADIGAAGTAAVEQKLFPDDPTKNWWTKGLKDGLLDLPGTDVWPITVLMYIYVRLDLTTMDAGRASVLKFFIDYVLSDEGQRLAEAPEFGFVGVPPKLLAVARQGAAALRLPTGARAWARETKKVQRFVGAGTAVISERRGDYNVWKRGQNADAVAALATSVSANQASLDAALAAIADFRNNQFINVQGGGGSNPSKYFWKVMETMEYESRVPIRLSYRSIGSRNSQYEMLGDANNTYKAYNDFGSGDTPMYVFCH